MGHILETIGKLAETDMAEEEEALLPEDADFEAIAVATEDGKGSPCGFCRQVMAEFSLDMTVMLVDAKGEITAESTVTDLLPSAFTPKNLLDR